MNLFAIFGVGGLVLTVLLGIQTGRLSHAKKDLTEARAAQLDPATGKKWADEYRVAAKDLAASQRDFATCKTNTTKLEGAVARQTTATDALAADLRRMTTEAGKAATASRTALAQALEASAAIRAPLPAGTVCERYEALDAVVVAGLKGRMR